MHFSKYISPLFSHLLLRFSPLPLSWTLSVALFLVPSPSFISPKLSFKLITANKKPLTKAKTSLIRLPNVWTKTIKRNIRWASLTCKHIIFKSRLFKLTEPSSADTPKPSEKSWRSRSHRLKKSRDTFLALISVHFVVSALAVD